MDNAILDDTTDTTDAPIETPEETINRLTVELAEQKHRAQRWQERFETRHLETKAFAKAMVPVIQAAFYEMESSDVIDLLPLDDVTSEVAEKMDLDAIAEDVAHNYLDTDQLAEDVMGKLDQSDIVSEVKSEAVQEVANVLIDALRSVG